MIRKILCKYKDDEIITNKKLSYIFVKLNNRCNARCSFCSCWKTVSDTSALDVINLRKQIDKQQPLEVNLSGGEVFLSNNFWPLLECSDNKIQWSITTNGSFLTKPVIDRMIRNNVKRLFISIDSYISEQNDRSRGINNLLEIIIKGIKYVKEKSNDIVVVINHTVTNRNYNQIFSFLYFTKENNVDAVNLIPIKDFREEYLSIQQIYTFYNQIEKAFKCGIEKTFFVNGYYQIFGNELLDFVHASLGNYHYIDKINCIMAYNTVFIDCESGDVFPCDTTIWRENKEDYILGNLTEQTLTEIWEGETIRQFRNSMFPDLRHSCHSCCDPNNKLI